MIKLLLPLFFLIQVVSESLQEEEVVYFTDSGYAEFTSRVPLHTFTGESSHLTGMIDLQENVIDFYLDLATLKTGIDRRDRDMYRTLEIDQYPFAEFQGSIDNSFNPGSNEKQTVVARGEFSIHGITREIRIEGQLQKQGSELLLEAEWVLLLEDYDIDPPGILFYRVNDEQRIRIEVVLKAHDRDEFLSEN